MNVITTKRNFSPVPREMTPDCEKPEQEKNAKKQKRQRGFTT